MVDISTIPIFTDSPESRFIATLCQFFISIPVDFPQNNRNSFNYNQNCLVCSFLSILEVYPNTIPSYNQLFITQLESIIEQRKYEIYSMDFDPSLSTISSNSSFLSKKEILDVIEIIIFSFPNCSHELPDLFGNFCAKIEETIECPCKSLKLLESKNIFHYFDTKTFISQINIS